MKVVPNRDTTKTYRRNWYTLSFEIPALPIISRTAVTTQLRYRILIGFVQFR